MNTSTPLGASNAGPVRSKRGATRSKYTTRACQECRRRRAKCDGQRPSCSRCLDKHLKCVFTAEVDHRGSAPRSYVALLQDRIKLLEQVLQLHSIDLDDSIAQLNTRVADPGTDLSTTADNSSLAFNDICADLEGTLYPEDPLSSFSRGGNEAQFFGPTSGRLELQPPRDASAPDHELGKNDNNSRNSTVKDRSQQRFNAYCQVLASDTLQDFSPELVEHLIAIYFEWEQPWFQIVDEALFRNSKRDNGRYFSPLLLYCILAIASRYSDRLEVRSDSEDANTAGIVFLEHAEALLHFDLKWPSITTIQSLAIMAILYVAIGSDAAGWLHHGMAIRLMLDMGLNMDSTVVTGSIRIPPEEVRLRRQIYWTLYCSDKLWASYTGRVCTMLDSQGSVPLPISFSSRTNPMETASPNDSKSIFLALILRELSTQCQILERILTTLYPPKRTTLDAEKRSFFDSCILALRGWFFSLPKELKVKLSDRPEQVNASPHVYILNMVYHTSFILLAKPFLPRGRNDSSPGLEAQDTLYDDFGQRASSLCNEAAKNICHLGERYRETFGSFRRSPLTATHCTLMGALVTLFLGNPQKANKTNDISKDLRSYMSTLRELSDSWTPPRRFWRTLTKVLRDRSRPLVGHQSLEGQGTRTAVENDASKIRNGTSQQGKHDASNTYRQLAHENIFAEANSSATRVDFNHSFLADGTNTLHLPPLSDFDQLDFSFLGEIQWDCINHDALGFDFQWIS